MTEANPGAEEHQRAEREHGGFGSEASARLIRRTRGCPIQFSPAGRRGGRGAGSNARRAGRGERSSACTTLCGRTHPIGSGWLVRGRRLGRVGCRLIAVRHRHVDGVSLKSSASPRLVHVVLLRHSIPDVLVEPVVSSSRAAVPKRSVRKEYELANSCAGGCHFEEFYDQAGEATDPGQLAAGLPWGRRASRAALGARAGCQEGVRGPPAGGKSVGGDSGRSDSATRFRTYREALTPK